MKENKSVMFLSIAKGTESVDAAPRKNYIGVGTVQILKVNPNKAQIKELMGYEPNEEPVYYGMQDVEGKQVPYARISFVIKTVADKCNGIETTQMLTFFLRNQYRQGSTSGKYQVIDAYGRTAWATKETIEKKEQIMYANGPAQIAKTYRPALVGEPELIDFLIKYLGIPAPANYVNGAWVEKDAEALKDCMCQLDCIKDYFNGKFDEIKAAIDLRPTNKFKVLFGIRTNDEGREFQDVYANMVLRNNTTDYSKLKKEIDERKANGALSNRIYEFTDIHEYVPTPTNFGATEASSDLPFGEAGPVTPWDQQ